MFHLPFGMGLGPFPSWGDDSNSPTGIMAREGVQRVDDVQRLLAEGKLDESALVQIILYARNPLFRQLAGQALARMDDVRPDSLEQAVRYSPSPGCDEAWVKLMALEVFPAIIMRRIARYSQHEKFRALATAELEKHDNELVDP